ncbi:MAG: 4-hydroxy-3-methylbut-2-enyl diphosphate reductase [Elusimicrobiales bacterium]|jgi:4-hydroxy-3-methylbut-2-enyl diphosphate reductase|nr:4-hydroxy-3-methylbut-2-enyl diphosphate reductase [Elusimicrobiales bacterium]
MSYRAQITVAASAGFCPGVKGAIDKVLELAAAGKGPIYTLGPLIHNKQVIQTLEEKGVRAVREASEIKEKGATLVIRAHGIPPELESAVRALDLNVVDATCPLVKRVHRNIKEWADKGYDTVIVGDADHAEVVGLMGYTAGRGHVVSGPEEAARLPRLEKANIVAQTTQETDVFLKTVEALRQNTGELIISNTICAPTKQRQQETVELSRRSGLVIVVGGKNSANTARLFQICSGLAPRAVHIEREDELSPELFDGASSVFITAGASTPAWMIEKVLTRARELTEVRRSPFIARLEFLWLLTVTSCVFTAAAAVALAYASMRLQGLPIGYEMLALAGLFVFSLHLTNRAAEKGTAVPDRAKHLLFVRFGRATRAVALLAGVAAIALAAGTTGPLALLLTAFFWGMGMLYPYKMPLGLDSLAKFPGSKDIMTALGWAFVCAALPALSYGSLAYKSSQLAAVFAFTLVFARSVMFGISHVHSDMIVGKENFYKAAGPKATYAAVLSIFIFMEGVLIALKNMAWKEPLVNAMIAGMFYYLGLMIFFYFRRMPEKTLAETLIDSQFLILAGLVWIS